MTDADPTTEHLISLGAKLETLDLSAEEEAVLDRVLERAAAEEDVVGFSNKLEAATSRTDKLALGFGLDPTALAVSPFGRDSVSVSPFGRPTTNVSPFGRTT